MLGESLCSPRRRRQLVLAARDSWLSPQAKRCQSNKHYNSLAHASAAQQVHSQGSNGGLHMQSPPLQLDLTQGRLGANRRPAALSFLLVLAVSIPFAAASAASAIFTDTGTYIGVPSPSAAGVDAFYGIRYAAPPEGALRWTPPQPPAVPTGPMVAAVPGPACPQPASTAPLPQSEDCLFLNVYVPAHERTHSERPVFEWIHGGALITGSG